MSHPRSFIRTDSDTSGLNPMYQSFSNELESPAQCEYDTINNDSRSNLIKPPLPARRSVHGPLYATPSETNSIPPSRITTINSLYASTSNAPSTLTSHTTTNNDLYTSNTDVPLKHPTLSQNLNSSSHRGSYRFEALPTRKIVYNRGVSRSGVSCSCSWSSLVMVIAMLVSMILSISVIVICALRITNIVIFLTTPTNTNQTIVSNLTTTNDNDSPTTFDNSTMNDTRNTCTCPDRNTTYLSFIETLKDIHSNLTDVSQEITMLNNFMLPLLPELKETLQYLSSRIDTIHNSINQLRVQATDTCSVLSEQQHITEPVLLDDLGDQTCPVNITEELQINSTFIDIDNECVLDSGFACSITPSSKSCVVFDAASFLEDGRILTDLICYVAFTNPDISGPVNGTAAIRQESFVNTITDQNIFNDIISNNPINVVGCQCLSFETTETISCRYISRHCKYTRGPSTSTIVL